MDLLRRRCIRGHNGQQGKRETAITPVDLDSLVLGRSIEIA